MHVCRFLDARLFSEFAPEVVKKQMYSCVQIVVGLVLVLDVDLVFAEWRIIPYILTCYKLLKSQTQTIGE